jgi:hypothetical protein
MNVAAQNDGRHRHREGVDAPASQKAQKFSRSRLHIRTIKNNVAQSAAAHYE